MTITSDSLAVITNSRKFSEGGRALVGTLLRTIADYVATIDGETLTAQDAETLTAQDAETAIDAVADAVDPQ
jgi:hypothetical protein